MKVKDFIYCLFSVLMITVYLSIPTNGNTVISKNVKVDSTIVKLNNDENKLDLYCIEEDMFVEYPYTVSNNGKEFIKKHEDLRLQAYNDPTPEKRSIGYGHQLLPGENFETITKIQAEQLFENDIKKVEASVNRLLKNTNKNFKYTQGFIDGLASMIYNCGEYGVSTTDFYQRLLRCRYDKNELNNINEADLNFTLAAVKTSKIFCEGHKIRRANEYSLMLN